MNRQFPALRGLAILFVLINHSIVMSDSIPQRFGHAEISGATRAILFSLKEIGLLAVPIFLFMSGAFLVYAIQNRDLKQSYQIIFKNLITIVIPYLIWSVVFYVLIWLMFGETYSLTGYMKNLITGYPHNFVPVAIFFYLIAPFIIRIGRRYPAPLLALFFLYQLVLFNFQVTNGLGFTMPEWSEILRIPILWNTLASWGIFFPMGILYNLHARKILPTLNRIKWPLAGLALACFIVAVLNEHDIVRFPVIDVLFPVLALPLAPVIPRDRIPGAKWLEGLGKRAYGLYLSNLIILSLIIYGIEQLAPALLDYHLISTPLIFILAILIPNAVMQVMERYPKQTGYRYVFG